MINNLYGDIIADNLKKELADRLKDSCAWLTIIMIGKEYGSAQYLKQIEKNCRTFGINIRHLSFPEDVQQEAVIDAIEELNVSEKCTAILIPLPLPKHLNSQKIIETIDVTKDIDGSHPYNLGRLFIGEPTLVPATAKAVRRLLAAYDIDLTGKNVVIVGRSSNVSKPLQALMTNADATVTLCHTKTKNLPLITKKADIVVTAIGKPKFFTAQYFTPATIIIDVGINFDGKELCGDVDYRRVANKVLAITPVPRGVGSLTNMMLMENFAEILERKNGNGISVT